MKSSWIRWLVPVAFGVAVSGCGAQSTHAAASSPSKSSSAASSMGGTHSQSAQSAQSLSGVSGDVLLGAFASPPSGTGNGFLVVDNIGTRSLMKIPLSTGANAFKVARDGSLVYVPTLQGTTYVVNLQSHQVIKSFSTPAGARIADISRAHQLLLITGPENVTAYSLSSLKQVWQAPIGGNALAIAGPYAYLSSNMSNDTTVLDVATGHTVSTIPVGHIEDSVYDRQTHTLWLADWYNGDMTIVNTLNNQVVKVIQEKQGGGFTMSNMMGSPGGFMQITVGPSGKHVYAASFSGDIMIYDAVNNVFDRNLAVPVAMAKLSGLAIDPSGQYAYTTVESQKETVAVSLKTGQVVSTMPGVLSNRWLVFKK